MRLCPLAPSPPSPLNSYIPLLYSHLKLSHARYTQRAEKNKRTPLTYLPISIRIYFSANSRREAFDTQCTGFQLNFFFLFVPTTNHYKVCCVLNIERHSVGQVYFWNGPELAKMSLKKKCWYFIISRY